MHQVEDVRHPPLCLRRNAFRHCSPLLPCQIAVVHLINMINVQQPTHHVTVGELAEHLEADVAETLLPSPRRAVRHTGRAIVEADGCTDS